MRFDLQVALFYIEEKIIVFFFGIPITNNFIDILSGVIALCRNLSKEDTIGTKNFCPLYTGVRKPQSKTILLKVHNRIKIFIART